MGQPCIDGPDQCAESPTAQTALGNDICDAEWLPLRRHHLLDDAVRFRVGTSAKHVQQFGIMHRSSGKAVFRNQHDLFGKVGRKFCADAGERFAKFQSLNTRLWLDRDRNTATTFKFGQIVGDVMGCLPTLIHEGGFWRLISKVPQVNAGQKKSSLPFVIAFINDLTRSAFRRQARQQKAARAGFGPCRKAARTGAALWRLPRHFVIVIGHVSSAR
ncbi:hypothetical protein AB9K34_14735 [Sedimentitalea sp. XS_ASV28]|uniref:hypothetical protein n=1 Tax=Sedimentitalea sp. XS_ASV28 TaxID=3241296 RepID=UPI003518CF20